MDTVLNLGVVRAIQYGTTAPLNLKMLWFDENIGVNYLKYYNTDTSTWDRMIVIPDTSITQTSVDLGDVDVAIDTLAAGVSYTGTLEIITDGNQVSVIFVTTLTIGVNVQGGFYVQIPAAKLPKPQVESAYSSLLVVKNSDFYPLGATISSFATDSFLSLAFTYSSILDAFTSGSVEIMGTVSYTKKQ